MKIRIRPQKAIQKVGNAVFNKGGTRKDQEAWLTVKNYIIKLEKELEKFEF